MRHFFTGDAVRTELLVVWLEKHGIRADAVPVDPDDGAEDDLGRQMRVRVEAAGFERAQQLFFAEREDEL